MYSFRFKNLEPSTFPFVTLATYNELSHVKLQLSLLNLANQENL